MVMCRNDATLGYFINLQMAIRECQKMLCTGCLLSSVTKLIANIS